MAADSVRENGSHLGAILRAIPVYPEYCRVGDLCEATGYSTRIVYQLIKKCPTKALFAELMNPDGSIIYCYPDKRCKDRTLDDIPGGRDGTVS